jgi:hypothetical protein
MLLRYEDTKHQYTTKSTVSPSTYFSLLPYLSQIPSVSTTFCLTHVWHGGIVHREHPHQPDVYSIAIHVYAIFQKSRTDVSFFTGPYRVPLQPYNTQRCSFLTRRSNFPATRLLGPQTLPQATLVPSSANLTNAAQLPRESMLASLVAKLHIPIRQLRVLFVRKANSTKGSLLYACPVHVNTAVGVCRWRTM